MRYFRSDDLSQILINSTASKWASNLTQEVHKQATRMTKGKFATESDKRSFRRIFYTETLEKWNNRNCFESYSIFDLCVFEKTRRLFALNNSLRRLRFSIYVCISVDFICSRKKSRYYFIGAISPAIKTSRNRTRLQQMQIERLSIHSAIYHFWTSCLLAPQMYFSLKIASRALERARTKTLLS